MHIGSGTTKEKLILFTAESLKICHVKQEIRIKEAKRKSKYDGITLPESPDDSIGYHASCYRFFTNIRSKQQTVAIECKINYINLIVKKIQLVYFSIASSSVNNMESDESNPQPTTEDEMCIDFEDDLNVSAGCIFCTRKLRWRNGLNQKLTKASTDTKKQRILEILQMSGQQAKVEIFQQSKHIEYHLSCLSQYAHSSGA